VESKDKTKSIKRISNILNIRFLSRCRMRKLIIGEMILAELIMKLEMKGLDFEDKFFSRIKGILVR